MRPRITSKEIEMKFAGRICAEYFDFARNLPVENKKSEITIEFSMSYLALSVPRTGLEPARLAALAPETSASTIPPPGLRGNLRCKDTTF